MICSYSAAPALIPTQHNEQPATIKHPQSSHCLKNVYFAGTIGCLRDPSDGDSPSIIIILNSRSVIISSSLLNCQNVNFAKPESQGDVGGVQLENATRYLFRCTVMSSDVKCQVKFFIGIASRPPCVNRWVEELLGDFSSLYFILFFVRSFTSRQETSQKSKQLPLNFSLFVSLII